jgi:hypothetical protein
MPIGYARVLELQRKSSNRTIIWIIFILVIVLSYSPSHASLTDKYILGKQNFTPGKTKELLICNRSFYTSQLAYKFTDKDHNDVNIKIDAPKFVKVIWKQTVCRPKIDAGKVFLVAFCSI